jgi:hypothetical protein
LHSDFDGHHIRVSLEKSGAHPAKHKCYHIEALGIDLHIKKKQRVLSIEEEFFSRPEAVPCLLSFSPEAILFSFNLSSPLSLQQAVDIYAQINISQLIHMVSLFIDGLIVLVAILSGRIPGMIRITDIISSRISSLPPITMSFIS